MTDLFLGYPDEGIMNWIKENCKTDYSKIPLCFEALEDGNVKLIKYDSPYEISLLYSFDNKNWNAWNYATGTDLKSGEKLYIKSGYDNGGFSMNSYNDYYNFITTKVNASGNIMSLLYNDFIDKTKLTFDYCFANLFDNCTNLINTSNLILPATKLTCNCYDSMFANCSNLISVIKLLATDINYDCYWFMFYNCLNITELHYPKSLENNSTFTSMSGSPKFGATNATVYYDL